MAADEALIDLLPDAVLVIDAGGVLMRANAAAEVVFGWSIETWLGRNLLELLHPEDLDMGLMSLGTVTEKERGTPIEVRARSADGWRLVEVIGSSFEENGEDRIALCVRDLTERRRWEVAGDDTAMFRSIVQNAAALTLLMAPDGSIRAASAALIRLTGRDPEELIGRPFELLVAPRDRGHARRALEQFVANDQRQLSICGQCIEPVVDRFVLNGQHVIRRIPIAPDRHVLSVFEENRISIRCLEACMALVPARVG